MTTTCDDTSLLIEIGQRQSLKAFDELYLRYEKRAFGLAYHLTGSRELAFDAVQEAMMDVWNNARKFIPGNASSWILRIVANRSLKLSARHRAAENMLEQNVSEMGAICNASPSDKMEQSEVLAALAKAIEKLPPLERRLLALHYTGGFSQEEVGRLISKPHQFVAYRLKGALKTLRSDLLTGGSASVTP